MKGIASRLDQVQRSGVRELIPGDADWLVALDDLGEGVPDVLWARGASSLLARPVQDFIMITGARASTSYGNHIARELAVSMAADERVVVGAWRATRRSAADGPKVGRNSSHLKATPTAGQTEASHAASSLGLTPPRSLEPSRRSEALL